MLQLDYLMSFFRASNENTNYVIEHPLKRIIRAFCCSHGEYSFQSVTSFMVFIALSHTEKLDTPQALKPTLFAKFSKSGVVTSKWTA